MHILGTEDNHVIKFEACKTSFQELQVQKEKLLIELQDSETRQQAARAGIATRDADTNDKTWADQLMDAKREVFCKIVAIHVDEGLGHQCRD